MNKKLLLISNKVFHYRVPIYNHLNSRLQSIGYELVVLTNELQKDNPHPPEFELLVQPFSFRGYKQAITRVSPAYVMLFLHIKDFIVWPLMAWMKFRQLQFIYWNHGVNLQTPDSVFKNIFFRTFHAASDAIVLYSENEAKFVDEKYRDKTFFANNTLNFNGFPEIDDSPAKIKSELGISYNKVVLFVGRIIANKRLDDLLAAASLLESGTGIVIVGGGLNAEQARLIDHSTNISYLGEIYDGYQINRIFKMADVFCIPGSMGLGINQAFYWGLPAVTENVLHSPEIMYLKDGYSGFIVEKGNVQALAEKINFLLSSDSTYAEFSVAAKSIVMEQGNIDVMCDGFVDAIDYLDG